MDFSVFPTKGNLMQSQNTLKLSNQGYELLDKKRVILTKEIMSKIERVKKIRSSIKETFKRAYMALQAANIMHGISYIEDVGHAIAHENSIKLTFSSVMGVEIPTLSMEEQKGSEQLSYGFRDTSSALDMARSEFTKVKKLTVEMAEIESSVFKIAVNIVKTQKRANALQNVVIPKYNQIIKHIKDFLEEKDREEFTRLKLIKNRK